MDVLKLVPGTGPGKGSLSWGSAPEQPEMGFAGAGGESSAPNAVQRYSLQMLQKIRKSNNNSRKKNLLFTLSVNANQRSKHKGCRIRQCHGSLMLSTKI